jgi:hypothetical protein
LTFDIFTVSGCFSSQQAAVDCLISASFHPPSGCRQQVHLVSPRWQVVLDGWWISACKEKIPFRVNVHSNILFCPKQSFILNLGPRTHIGQQELDKVGLLSVKDRVIQMKMNHVFKIFQGTAPDYLNLNFTRTSSIHKYSTRGSPFNFIVPKIKGQASQTFYFTAIRHWNFMPNSIKETGNFPKFKHAVKKHLSDQARIAELNPMYHDRY